MIIGQEWKIERHTRRTMPQSYGCTPVASIDHTARTICLRTDLAAWRVFEHLLHELLHAQDPAKPEETVEREAKELRQHLLEHFEITLKPSRET